MAGTKDEPKKTDRVVARAAEVIRAGGLVIYPTDTVYGIGADATSDTAIAKVFQAKARPIENPIPIAVSSIEMAKKFVKFNPLAEKVFRKMMPGPLTIVLKTKRGMVPELLTGGTGKIGLRIPDHPIAIKLIELVGGPITSTSANLSGKPASLTVREALEQLGKNVDLVIDAGKCKLGKPSTVIDISSGTPKTIREGPTTAFELNLLLKKLKM